MKIRIDIDQKEMVMQLVTNNYTHNCPMKLQKSLISIEGNGWNNYAVWNTNALNKMTLIELVSTYLLILQEAEEN